jgi:hypothetical protein
MARARAGATFEHPDQEIHVHLNLSAALVALAIVLPSHAAPPKATGGCPAGQTAAPGGGCATACPTDDLFMDPSACECPAGFGKVLFGSGGGKCERLACPTGTTFSSKDCECPAGYEKKAQGKGKATCQLKTAKAK